MATCAEAAASRNHRSPRPLARNLSIGAGLIGFAVIAIHAAQPAPATAIPGEVSLAHPVKQPAAPPADAFVEPRGATVELFASVAAGDSLSALLERAGVARKDAAQASALITDGLPAGIPEGTEVAILLGEAEGSSRRLERLAFEPSLAFRITIGRTRTGALKLARDGLDVDARPRRFSGTVDGDLFWSLRAAGVPAQAASELRDAVSRRMNLNALGAGDRFELVIDHVRSGSGESRGGPLLYAAIDRQSAKDLTLVRWSIDGQTGLFDPSMPQQQVDGFARPVAGRVSSRFGYRTHPILGFARLHRGMDFAASSGTPVIAAADGIVTAAKWSGGYGRQVRLVHSKGVTTSYSHLSDYAVVPGTRVTRGQVIGFVGSSGLSTGPHLHFEVRQHGRAVDPSSFTYGPAALDAVDIAALRARAEQLRGV